MTRPLETVRTHRRAWLADEAVHAWLHPKSCPIHLVQWWTDEPSLDELMGKTTGCPCCDGTIPLEFLLFIEEPRNKRLKKRKP